LHESGRTNHANPAARPIVRFIYVGLAIYVALSASQLIHIAQKTRNSEIFIPLLGFSALSEARNPDRATGPAAPCHRAGQRTDPVGRPNDKLREIRNRSINLAVPPGVRHPQPGYTLQKG
jgi:hypothetical protein